MKQLLDWLKPYISLWVLFPIALLILIPTGMIFLPFDQVLPAEILNILQQLATPKKMAIMLILFLSMSFCYAFLYREFSKIPKNFIAVYVMRHTRLTIMF